MSAGDPPAGVHPALWCVCSPSGAHEDEESNGHCDWCSEEILTPAEWDAAHREEEQQRIDDLPPGAELDALVSVRVMGQEPRTVRLCGETNTVECWPDASGKVPADGTLRRLDVTGWLAPRRWSHDPVWALQVVARLHKRFPRVELHSHGDGWEVRVRGPQRVVARARGRLLAHAICRAALKAMDT